MRRRTLLLAAAGFTLLAPIALRAEPDEATAGELRLRVTELSRSLDLSRGKTEFLTVTVEITGKEAGRLRRVQPLRDDFQVLAGKQELRCRWLRGGSLPEDPQRLRFTLGFTMPPASVRRVSLRANLPRLEGEDAREVRFAGLRLGEDPHQGAEEKIHVSEFKEEAYVPPALPPRGELIGKGGPVDVRVFRQESAGKGSPERAVVLSFFSQDLDLYDPTLDVSGTLIVEGGPATQLLSASLRRDPSRSVKSPPYPPFVMGRLYFAVPAQGRATGAILRLHRRPPAPPAQPVLIRDLPVPGGS